MSDSNVPRDMKLQRQRLRMTLLAVANTGLQSLVLALYAWVGELSWQLVIAFLLAGIGIAVVFAVVIGKGWNLRMKEPSMLVLQMVANCVVQLVFLVLAPQLWMLFLVAVCVTYNFAMMSFNPRQFTAAWILVGLAMAVALYVAREGIGRLGVSNVHLLILWLFFFLSLRQLTIIGSRFSELRKKLSDRNQELSASLAKLQELAGEQRLVEREKIARRLHDTLLQGIQGLLLRFQSATERIPPGEAARTMMEDAMELADQVLVAGRDQLAGLHVANSAGANLAEALQTAGEELASDGDIAFEMKIHGRQRELHDLVSDESYRVGRDALLNAFQHSSARQVTAEVSYEADMLRVSVRDDGIGIAAEVLSGGDSKTHSGLSGMQVRAHGLGGQLQIESMRALGTVVELRVPSVLAYRQSPERTSRGPLGWLEP